MTDSAPQSQDHDLDQLIDELKAATGSATSVSPLERRLIDVLDRMWMVLQTTRRDIDLLQEEQRGWSRQEMSIDQPGSAPAPDEGISASRLWVKGNMVIVDP